MAPWVRSIHLWNADRLACAPVRPVSAAKGDDRGPGNRMRVWTGQSDAPPQLQPVPMLVVGAESLPTGGSRPIARSDTGAHRSARAPRVQAAMPSDTSAAGRGAHRSAAGSRAEVAVFCEKRARVSVHLSTFRPTHWDPTISRRSATWTRMDTMSTLVLNPLSIMSLPSGWDGQWPSPFVRTRCPRCPSCPRPRPGLALDERHGPARLGDGVPRRGA